MSLLPIFFGDRYNSMRPSRILNQHFGVPLQLEDLFSPMTIPEEFRTMMLHPGYYRPWKSAAAGDDSGSTVSWEKDKYQVNLDVQQFKPEEITVKVTGKNEITVEGKHEEQQDEHGFISRHFVRKYVVPQGCNIEGVVSHLSSDGVLSISAPREDTPTTDHKEIPITQTGKPAIKPDDQKN
ncbi:PREDICTED: protein lethal(2)essential for life-like [Nicrophorus vespilloides]|uniref:Protein lethal(2)essential for life-like n=1 Tax=Nicrophorus vespilloides TaxID=110193 RepID=A0ABM1NBY9_NICVS|nr:PREDICTED: protein lethal(2)essential for life-like [Nicrophorus vespilloides]